MALTEPPPVTPVVEISKIAAKTLIVPIVGTAPLIVHRFDEKAKRIMLDAMQGRKTPKAVRDPEADYQAAFYRVKGGGYGAPVLAFKAATVGASRYFGKSVPMTLLRQCLFFRGVPSHDDSQALAVITGEPVMREDAVTVGQGGHDLRYRPMFPEWSTELTVVFVSSMLSQESVLSLIDAGGMGVGVGEWRPERRGDFGTYMIDPTREVQML